MTKGLYEEYAQRCPPPYGRGEDARKRLLEMRASAHSAYVARMSPAVPEDTAFLAPEDEELVLAYYHGRVDETCRFFAKPARGHGSDTVFPRIVAPHAHALLRRYHAAASVMAQDGKHVMLVCVLLAAKAADVHPTLDSFARRVPNTSGDLLLRLETRILDAVAFDVVYPSPHDALMGEILALCDPRRGSNVPAEAASALWEAAMAVLDRLAPTDTALVTPPHVLARVAIALSLPDAPPQLADAVRSIAGEHAADVESARRDLERAESLAERVRSEMAHIKAFDSRMIALRRLDSSALSPSAQ